MARSSRGSRPAARPAQTRGAHTAAAPANYSAPRATPATAPTPAAGASAQPQGPGMMAQMAANAGSVAIGSTIGHGLSSMLFGGSSAAPAAESQAPAQQQQSGVNCEVQAKEALKCLEKADYPSCSYYFDQLKACQSAAAPY